MLPHVNDLDLRLRLILRKQLGNTLKSAIHLADWHGTSVVVKCVKMERRSWGRESALAVYRGLRP